MTFFLKYKAAIIKYLVMLISIVGGYYALANYHDKKGYDRAVTEITRDAADKISKATGEAINAAEKEIAKALERQRILFDAELQIAEDNKEIEIQIREVISDVEKIVYVNNCGKLNSDSIKLLNKSINYVNRTPSD